jgi:MerR family transcriptional regulator/heat shock protein HspR
MILWRKSLSEENQNSRYLMRSFLARLGSLDIQRLLQIQRLTQDMGVNLAGVELVLSLLEKLEHMEKLHDELEARLADVEAKLISARPLPRGI